MLASQPKAVLPTQPEVLATQHSAVPATQHSTVIATQHGSSSIDGLIESKHDSATDDSASSDDDDLFQEQHFVRAHNSKPFTMPCTRASAVLLTQHDIEPATQCNIGSVPQESAVLCTQASAVPATQGTIEPATQASAVLCTQANAVPATQGTMEPALQESAVLCTQASAVPATQGTIEPATQASAVLCTQANAMPSEMATVISDNEADAFEVADARQLCTDDLVYVQHGDGMWYFGRLVRPARSGAAGMFFVEFGDGDSGEVDFEEEPFRLASSNNLASQSTVSWGLARMEVDEESSSQVRPRRKVPKQALLSDDEENAGNSHGDSAGQATQQSAAVQDSVSIGPREETTHEKVLVWSEGDDVDEDDSGNEHADDCRIAQAVHQPAAIHKDIRKESSGGMEPTQQMTAKFACWDDDYEPLQRSLQHMHQSAANRINQQSGSAIRRRQTTPKKVAFDDTAVPCTQASAVLSTQHSIEPATNELSNAAMSAAAIDGTMERNAMPHEGSFARSLGTPDHTASIDKRYERKPRGAAVRRAMFPMLEITVLAPATPPRSSARRVPCRAVLFF